MNKLEFFKELKPILVKILDWVESDSPQKDVNLDELIFTLFNKYNVDTSYFPLGVVYTYLDIVCDAKRHNFKEVNKGYGYQNVISDLRYLINLIDTNQLEKIENDGTFFNKLLQVTSDK